MKIIKRFYHVIFIGHKLPDDVNEDNIENNLNRKFRCNCGHEFKIIRGIFRDYTVIKI